MKTACCQISSNLLRSQVVEWVEAFKLKEKLLTNTNGQNWSCTRTCEGKGKGKVSWIPEASSSLLISLWNSNNFFGGCVSLSENFIWPTGYKTFKVSLYFPNRHGKMNHHNLCVCLKGRVQTWVVTCTCSQKNETPFVPLLYEFLLHWKEGKWESHEQDSFRGRGHQNHFTKAVGERGKVVSQHNLYNSVFK